jgi:hypothetical protein
MGRMLDEIADGQPLLHIDCLDYAERLLGPADWSSPESVAALINKAQALLPSDVVVLPVSRMLSAMPPVAAMAARSRGTQPLRALLADTDARARLMATVSMLVVPRLALGLDAPAELAVLATELISQPQPDVDEDLIDDAAIFSADFLRIFSAMAVEAIILTESSPRQSVRALYAPIGKCSAAYGWACGIAVHGSLENIWPSVKTIHIPSSANPEDTLALVKALKAS